MNKPPFIFTDLFTDMVASISTKNVAAGRDAVNSSYGFITELTETLTQRGKSAKTAFDKKMPWMWLAEPFKLNSPNPPNPNLYGELEEISIFILADSKKEYKSNERKELVYKPILYPLLDLLFEEIAESKVITKYMAKQNFSIIDRYYWGENQKAVIPDTADSIQVIFRKLPIDNNYNCPPLQLDNSRVKREKPNFISPS